MPADNRRRVRLLFEEALEMPAAERGGFLERAYGDDSAVKAAVERLLRADAAADGFLGEPLVRIASAIPSPTASRPPARIGPYRLEEKIGEGGMGTVYGAVRDDEAFEREVAVKLITHGAMSDETRRRLRIERQILAGLDHPWIAQIFDGGTTDEGLPYLVMERVEGEPIDRFCDREALAVRERLELFCKVCAAVHCSHQNLIVHCDLKPSNILVTDAGDPKLLDFGIAKLLSQENNQGREEPTTVGSRPLTPEYASPEQLRGETLSTASDVYSLGVLLYKLLTGQRPEAASGRSGDRGDERDLIAPSVAVAREGLSTSRQLRGDLDAIVLKALRSSPEARFGSAQQLAEDVERYLSGFPVLARQGSFRYRARKFLRRHRASVAAAVMAITMLIVFALDRSAMASRLSQERAKLQEVVDFFRGFFEHAGPLVDERLDLTLREAVDQHARMIEVGLEDQPAVKVEIATVLGDIYRELGRPDQALDWSERALALQRQVVGEDSQAYALALVQVGSAQRELGSFEEAERNIRAGLGWLQARPETEPVKLVQSLNHLVMLLCYQGRYQEVDADSAAALHLAEESLDNAALETLVAMTNRGQVLRRMGETAEAERLYESALLLYRQTFEGPHPHMAPLLHNLGLIQRARGDLASASRTLNEANSQYLELFGPTHYARIHTLDGLARLSIQQERPDDAVAYYRDAIEVGIASKVGPSYILRPAVEFGELLLSSRRCREGEQQLRDAMQHTQKHAGSSWRYAEIEGQLGECLTRHGSHAEARALLERSYEHLKAQADVDPDTLRRALQRLVALYEAVGEDLLRKQAIAALEPFGVLAIGAPEHQPLR